VSERRMQSAALNGAYRNEVHPSQYCEILINRAYPEDLRQGCVTFIHEYGHLLGKEHNSNIHSPMSVHLLRSCRTRWVPVISACRATSSSARETGGTP
jgi:hypothetical protein